MESLAPRLAWLPLEFAIMRDRTHPNPLPQAGEGAQRAVKPFSRLLEKVARSAG